MEITGGKIILKNIYQKILNKVKKSYIYNKIQLIWDI